MAAFLRLFLIFDLHAGQSGPLKFPNGFPYNRRRPIAGVPIDDGGKCHRPGNGRRFPRHVRQADQSDIGQAPGGRDRGSRHIDDLESGALDLHGRQGITGAGDGHGPAGQQFTQALCF